MFAVIFCSEDGDTLPETIYQRFTMAEQYFIGDCRDESIISELFGDVSAFACLVEENGDNFVYGKVCVEYDENSKVVP